jgi:hypothetical protein
MTKFTSAAIALLAASATTTSVNAFLTPSSSSSSCSFMPRVTTNTVSSSTAVFETPLSPLTIWGDQIKDIRSVQDTYKKQKYPDFAPTISAKDLNIQGDKEAQLKYAKDNATEIKTKMVENGAVIFRDFDLMKEQEGFVKFYEAIGMKTCLDPLHSVSARPTVDGKKGSPVYEAVNKESRKNFFIGTYTCHGILGFWNKQSRMCRQWNLTSSFPFVS